MLSLQTGNNPAGPEVRHLSRCPIWPVPIPDPTPALVGWVRPVSQRGCDLCRISNANLTGFSTMVDSLGPGHVSPPDQNYHRDTCCTTISATRLFLLP